MKIKESDLRWNYFSISGRNLFHSLVHLPSCTHITYNENWPKKEWEIRKFAINELEIALKKIGWNHKNE